MRGAVLVTGLVAGAAIAVTTTPTSGAAPGGDPTRFDGYRRTTVDALATPPLGLRGERTVTAVVELSEPSVAEATGDALEAGNQLSPTEERAVRDAASAEQAAVAGEVEQQGGEVQAVYEDALNGLTVSMPLDAVAALESLPEVVRVRPVRVLRPSNGPTNAYTGVPLAWQDLGVTGAGVLIAVIDDGVDYTHADFGGPGTVEAYAGNDRTLIEEGTFPTPKVVGGADLVGDDYDAESDDRAVSSPQPDPDPLACGEHGTHVAGTAAGNGVNGDGTRYTGPYEPDAVEAGNLLVHPGSAPEASILAIKVFGCEGATTSDIVVAALDFAVAQGADVINLSLGSPWGRADDPEAIAATNAARAGAVVVAAAGNEGPNAYMTGSPAAATRVLSVGAMDAVPFFPGASIAAGNSAVPAMNANAGLLPVTAPVHVVRDETGAISVGCEPEDYDAATAGSIAVVERGVCDRIAKPALAEEAGAVALVMVNNAPGFSPFEGSIPGVDIPFLSVAEEDRAALVALDSAPATVAATGAIANPGFTLASDFTAGGPRTADAGMKPELTAPGVSLRSAAAGTGSLALNLSGTSMASPHVSGIAALLVQAHPDWAPELLKAALVNTASTAASKLGDLRVLLDGNGVVDPVAALTTDVVAFGRGREPVVSFSLAELLGGFRAVEQITFVNTGGTSRTFDLDVLIDGDALGASVVVTPPELHVPAGQQATATLQVTLSPDAVAALPAADDDFDVAAVTGKVLATPSESGVGLSVPFQLVPHGRSRVVASAVRNAEGVSEIGIRNLGLHAGDADLYEWVLSDGRDAGAFGDLRAVGVQVFDAPPELGSAVPDDKLLVFAISLHQRFSSAAENEYHVLVDVDGDNTADHLLVAADAGLLLDGVASGELAAFAVDLAAEEAGVLPAIAPPGGSVLLVPALASDLGVTAAAPTFAVTAATTSVAQRGVDDTTESAASVNAFDPQRSAGDFLALAPGATGSFPVTSRAPAGAEVASLGWMVVTLDDRSGVEQAALVPA